MNGVNLKKGDYLILDQCSVLNTVYFYPKHEEENIGNTDDDVSEIENEVAAMASYNKDEFDGEIVNVYKNNLVVAIDSKDKDYVKQNQNITIRITKDNNAYECSLKILGIKDEGEKIIMVLSIPVIEKKVDRRRFFRLKVKFGVRYCILPEGEYHTIADVPKGCFLKTKKVLSHDISAGGVTIIANENCEIGTYALICVYLPNKIDILCRIVRTVPYKDTNKVLLSMKYVYIYEPDRDKIAGFVIRNEIYRRNKANKEKV